MVDDIKELAGAVKSVADFGKVALDATTRVGSFISKLFKEPLEQVSGMVNDQLQAQRLINLINLEDKVGRACRERGIKGETKAIPAKLGVPIIQNASLEEDETLQSIWANLIASAIDPKFDDTLRTAFIDILKQMEIMDVHMLKAIYELYELDIEKRKKWSAEQGKEFELYSPSWYSISKYDICHRLQINPNDLNYENALDNLMRLGCLTSYVESVDIDSKDAYTENPTLDHQYDKVCIKVLGLTFVRACIAPPHH